MPPPSVRPPPRAPQNAAVLAFAKKYAGKFRSELPNSSLTVGSAVTVRVRLDEFRLGSYDGNAEVFKTDFWRRLDELRFQHSCRGAGSFTGQNAFGVRAVVTRRVCDDAVVRGDTAFAISGQFKLSPAEYRKASDGGFEADGDFTIAPDRQGHAAWFQTLLGRATIDVPVQEETNLWTVYGDIDEVRVLTPGGAGNDGFRY